MASLGNEKSLTSQAGCSWAHTPRSLLLRCNTHTSHMGQTGQQEAALMETTTDTIHSAGPSSQGPTEIPSEEDKKDSKQ